MSNEMSPAQKDMAKLIKHEFDRQLASKDPGLCRFNEIHCVLSPEGLLSVTPVGSRGSKIILSFDREESGDLMPMERVHQAVENNWWDLQQIIETEIYKRQLAAIDDRHS